MEYLNLTAIRFCTESEGPGRRFAIWCQGCKRRCQGCCNEHMQPLEVRHIVTVSDLEGIIEEAQKDYDLEGVSFIGGEPLLQARGFAELAEWCQTKNLSVLVFTGYNYDDLKNVTDEVVDRLLHNTDVLVDGQFVGELYDNKRDWVGSTNQRVIYLTDRYQSGTECDNGSHSMEIRIKEDSIDINGWPF